MIDQSAFFGQFGFTPTNISDIPCFQGPDGNFYRLEEQTSTVAFCRSCTHTSLPESFASFARILPETDLTNYLEKRFQQYLQDAGLFMKEHDSYHNMAMYVHRAIGKDLHRQELMNLFNLYSFAVQKGSKAKELAEACRDVIHINQIRPDQYVMPELHTMLLQVSDNYYDFIVGTENNISQSPDFQHRLLHFMQEYSGLSSSDIIIYISIINSSPSARDENIYRIIRHFHNETGFRIFDRQPMIEESLQDLNKHEWQVTKRIINGNGYTFRQARSICFLDYMDSCMGGSILKTYDTDTALFYDFLLRDTFLTDDLEDALIRHMESIAINSEKHRIITPCDCRHRPAFERAGYNLCNDLPDMLIKTL